MSAELQEGILRKIKILNTEVWENRVKTTTVSRWLSQFSAGQSWVDNERLQMAFLLSHFMYFGEREIRQLLRHLYRGLYRRRVIADIRRLNGGSTDSVMIEAEFAKILGRTLFMGPGNPSESGAHLLLYLRQVTGISKDRFGDSGRIVSVSLGEKDINGRRERKISLVNAEIDTYVFVDDLCGSGDQICRYTTTLIRLAKRARPNIKFTYLCLFATEDVFAQPPAFGGGPIYGVIARPDPLPIDSGCADMPFVSQHVHDSRGPPPHLDLVREGRADSRAA